jgi:ectoine hydroxylase-related dioxygenase (phytanoyl-CoA dioxygenase family)
MTTAPTLPAAPTERRVPKPIWTSRVLLRFLQGYRHYRRTGETPREAYADMRRLFRMTNGRFNDTLAMMSRVRHPPVRLPGRWGILGDLRRGDVRNIASQLREDGLVVFDRRLPAEVCDRLRSFAERCPASPIPAPPGARRVRYDRRRWIASKYILEKQPLLENRDMQRIVADHSLLAVAQAYLACQPVLSGYSIWWSTSFTREACSEAAQLFHFDMSQIKFLKFFVYLTDVTNDTGAHQYVLGSHRRLPPELRHDRRYRDDEIFRHIPEACVETITGPKGLIFAADTRGLHKGSPLLYGERLILQLQYSISGFGDDAAEIEVNDRFPPELREQIERYPRIYERFFDTHVG